MAFNPNNYKAPTLKTLPVILLLDVSGSMYGEKINALYDATQIMIKGFEEANSREKKIDVAIITFGNEIKLHTSYTNVTEFVKKGLSTFSASGGTPLGEALRMAKDMIEDKNVTPSNIYRPAVILVSDGEPTDHWETSMDNFKNGGRSSKCQRFSVAIGNDANETILKKFVSEPENFLLADKAEKIVDIFKFITNSVSMRSANNSQLVVSTSSSYDNNTNNIEEDEDDEY